MVVTGTLRRVDVGEKGVSVTKMRTVSIGGKWVARTEDIRYHDSQLLSPMDMYMEDLACVCSQDLACVSMEGLVSLAKTGAKQVAVSAGMCQRLRVRRGEK